MTNSKCVGVILVVGLLLTTIPAHAVPNLISYQGLLNDDAGVPVNSTVTFLFNIYDVETGGTALWSENQVIPVSNGVFNVQLGAVEPIPQSVFAKSQLYLGIAAGADTEMTPRQLITGTAYSHRSEILMPIGSIIAWHKSMVGTPLLTDVWAECNGQTLSDPESIYDGQELPNLNGTNSILKGSDVSGVSVRDVANPSTIPNSSGAHPLHGNTTHNNDLHGKTLGNHSHTLPIDNMTYSFEVVWIMRVK